MLTEAVFAIMIDVTVHTPRRHEEADGVDSMV